MTDTKQSEVPNDLNEEVRQILVLPNANHGLHDTVNEQLRSFNHFIDAKMTEYKEILHLNSVVVFAVNYIQNRFIVTEFCVEIAKLFGILNVRNQAEFNKAIEALKADDSSEEVVTNFQSHLNSWDQFIEEVESKLDEKVGPCQAKIEDDELPELGVQSKTISHYVNGSLFAMVLVVVVRSFSCHEVNQHILGLYNKMAEFHKMGCDVYLLTKGPPIGSRGGAYIKLIGVPFRKLYDEQEAVIELKNHRRSAIKLAGWNSLIKVVEVTLGDEARPTSARVNSSQLEDQTSYITQKGGTILVDRAGNVLYKYVEENGAWPTVDEIIAQVKKVMPPNVQKSTNLATTAKVDSELSAVSDSTKEKKKSCCTIL